MSDAQRARGLSAAQRARAVEQAEKLLKQLVSAIPQGIQTVKYYQRRIERELDKLKQDDAE